MVRGTIVGGLSARYCLRMLESMLADMLAVRWKVEDEVLMVQCDCILRRGLLSCLAGVELP